MATLSDSRTGARSASLPGMVEAARGRRRFGAVLRQFKRDPTSAGPDALVLYYAYGANGHAVLEGRVIDHQVSRPLGTSDSRFVNLSRTLRLVFNEERAHFPVNVALYDRRWEVRTDVEGYFHLEMQALDGVAGGWHPIEVSAGRTQARIPLLLPPPENRHGVISDIDDTIMVTDVNRWSTMLANTFLKNPLQRQIVRGMPELFRILAARNSLPSAAPVFYVSASPRQLHMPLQAVLDHHGFPPGVLITKRVTNDATREPLRDQMTYKLKRIEEILARVAHVTFTLIGDDGEHDPEIFREVRGRHPHRIDHVWIRRVHPDSRRVQFEDQVDVATLLSEDRAINF
ncbi:MAG: phosphatase domain-containing protein [Steroidobacteraceae bacterium]